MEVSKLLLLSSDNFVNLDHLIQKEIYSDFYRYVYPIIHYMVKDHQATEDIIQNSFLKAIKKPPIVSNENELKAWIRTVVRNDAYNYLRKNKKNSNLIDTDDVLIHKESPLSTSSDHVEKTIERKEMIAYIDSILKQLKIEFRILIELRWRYDYSYKEIADTLDITEDTVKYRLHRARSKIKKIIGKKWGDHHE